MDGVCHSYLSHLRNRISILGMFALYLSVLRSVDGPGQIVRAPCHVCFLSFFLSFFLTFFLFFLLFFSSFFSFIHSFLHFLFLLFFSSFIYVCSLFLYLSSYFCPPFCLLFLVTLICKALVSHVVLINEPSARGPAYLPTYRTYISHLPSFPSLYFHNIPHFYTFTIQLCSYVKLRGLRPHVSTCPRPQRGNLLHGGTLEVACYLPTHHTFISHLLSFPSLYFHNIPHFYTFTIRLCRYVELRGS